MEASGRSGRLSGGENVDVRGCEVEGGWLMREFSWPTRRDWIGWDGMG